TTWRSFAKRACEASANRLVRRSSPDSVRGRGTLPKEIHIRRRLCGLRAGGHLVAGHIDGVGRVQARRERGPALDVEISVTLIHAPGESAATLRPSRAVAGD